MLNLMNQSMKPILFYQYQPLQETLSLAVSYDVAQAIFVLKYAFLLSACRFFLQVYLFYP